MGSVFQPEKKSTSTCSPEIPKKRFKNEAETAPENSSNMALNFAARVISARAQWIQHQMLQQQKMTEQSKLSQMLQIAQFQAAYLALMNANKTENSDIEDEETASK